MFTEIGGVFMSMTGTLKRIIGIPQLFCIFFLKTYRRFCSPLYGDVCKYFPSCSAYALEAVTLYGAVRGSYLTVKRLLRCNPFSKGGVDHVPHSEEFFARFDVIPEILVLNHPLIGCEK